MWGPRTTSGVSYGDNPVVVSDEQDVVHPVASVELPLQERGAAVVSDTRSLTGLTLRSGQQLPRSTLVARTRAEHRARRSVSEERASSLRRSGKQTLRPDDLLPTDSEATPSMKMVATPQVKMTPQGLRKAQQEGLIPERNMIPLQSEEQIAPSRSEMQIPLQSESQNAPWRHDLQLTPRSEDQISLRSEIHLPPRSEELIASQRNPQIPPWRREFAIPPRMMMLPPGMHLHSHQRMAVPSQGAIPKAQSAVPSAGIQQRHMKPGALRTCKKRRMQGTSVVSSIGWDQMLASSLQKPSTGMVLGNTQDVSQVKPDTFDTEEQPKENAFQQQQQAGLRDITPQEESEMLAYLAENRRRRSSVHSTETLSCSQVDQKRQTIPPLSWQKEKQQEQMPALVTYQGFGELSQPAGGPLVPEQQRRDNVQVGDEVMESVSHHGYQLGGLQNPVQQAVGSQTTAAQRVQQWVGNHGHVLDARHVQEACRVTGDVGYVQPTRTEQPPEQHQWQNTVPMSEVPAHPAEAEECVGASNSPPQVEDTRVVQEYVPVVGQVPPYWSLYSGREKSQPLYAPCHVHNMEEHQI
jgi:hypothetical protein